MQAYEIVKKVRVESDQITGIGGYVLPKGRPNILPRTLLLYKLCEATINGKLLSTEEVKACVGKSHEKDSVSDEIRDLRDFLERVSGSVTEVLPRISQKGWRIDCEVTLGAPKLVYPKFDVLSELAKLGIVSLPVVDNSVRLAPLSLQGDDELPVEYDDSAWASIDIGSTQPGTGELLKSLQGFLPEVSGFLEPRLKVPDATDAQWKLGMSLVQAPIDVLDKSTRIVVRPLSYLVTEMFNRAFILRLIAQPHGAKVERSDKALDELLPKCLKASLSNAGSFNFPFPSQLFVEIGVVTRDRRCLLMRKRNNPGVVAGIGRSWTCGPEFGFAAADLRAASNGPGKRRISVKPVIEKALVKELGVLPERLIRWRIDGVALQHVHLNTALYGHCHVDLTGAELMEKFEEKGRSLIDQKKPDPFHRGLQPGEPKAELVSVDAIDGLLKSDMRGDGEYWHPTAQIRLKSIVDSLSAG